MVDTAEEKAEALLDSIKKNKGIYDAFAKNFRERYKIIDKTIAEWEKIFKVSIPEDLNPQQCKNTDIELMKLHQEATFYKAAARAILQALEKGLESQYRSKFSALVAEYKSKNEKLPAAGTLDSLARINLDDIDGAIMSANIANNFWEDVIKHLDYCRKLVESIAMSNGIQAKMDGNHKGNLYG